MQVPTPEQQLILDEQNSTVVIARPGSGKTFTLSLKIRTILEAQPEYRGVAAISYTNKASEELRHRCMKNGFDKKNSFFGTIDKFFIGEIIFPFLSHIFGKSQNELIIAKIDDLKREDLAEDIAILSQTDEIKNNEHVSAFKSLYINGFIPLEFVGKFAIYIYDKSLACRRYLSARYTHLIVDEYQDSGLEQHKMFIRLHAEGIVAIAVGDINQSIYAFSGKSSKFLRDLSNNSAFKTFALTINHRCHPSISNYSLRLMSSSATFTLETDLRIYLKIVDGSEIEISAFIDKAIASLKKKFKIENNNSFAVLVRGGRTGEIISNNLQSKHKYFKETPLDSDSALWSHIFKSVLIFASDPNRSRFELVEGEFGLSADTQDAQLIFTFLKKIKDWVISRDGAPPVGSFVSIASILLPKANSQSAVTLLENIMANSELLESYGPAANDEVQIMTLHKSKGLEFDIVFHLDLYDYILPGYDAMSGNQESLNQDLNLHYVGITRAKKACILCSSTHRHRNKKNSEHLEVINATPSSFFSRNELHTLRKRI